MRRSSLFFVFFLLPWLTVLAQKDDFIRSSTYSVEKIIKEFHANGGAFSARQEATVINIPVQVHGVRSTDGTIPDYTAIQADFAAMNAVFQTIGYNFVFCSGMHVIEEPRYATLEGLELNEMVTYFNVPGAIDYFYVDEIDEGRACGTAYLGFGMGDMLLMDKHCLGIHTLIHETGHYLGLPHTHDTQGGLEFVDGTNCQTAGDMICDTPAEPDLRTDVDYQTCKYIGTAKDPKGVLYKPSVDNFMSYAPSTCRKKFTPQQFAFMQAVFNEKYAAKATCDNQADFTPGLRDSIKRLSKNATNVVPFFILNRSHVSATTNLEYSVTLVGPSGVEKSLANSSLNKTFSGFQVDTIKLSVPIAANAEEGVYTIRIKLNGNKKTTESNYDNNVFEQRVGVYSSNKLLADLTVRADMPTKYETGYQLSFVSYQSNIGSLDLSHFDQYAVRTYLSKDETYSLDDTLVGERYFTNVRAGQIDTITNNYALPRNISKLPFLIIVMDQMDDIDELDEDNNITYFKLISTTPDPSKWKYDLSITDLKFVFGDIKDTLELNSSYTYDVSTINNSSIPWWENLEGDLKVSDCALYLSKDDKFDASDMFLGLDQAYFYNGGGFSSVNAKFSPTITPGKYYILAYVDPHNKLIETNENNNVYSRAVTIVKGLNPDLIMLNTPVIGSNTILYDNPVSYNVTVKNVGFGPSIRWRVVYYLTKDSSSYVNSQLVDVSAEYSTVFAPNTTFAVTSSFTVDSTATKPGSYYFVSCIENISGQEYYANNCKVNPKMVTLGLVTDIEQFNSLNRKISLYPNPSSDLISIGSNDPIKTVDIMNELGIVQESHTLDQPSTDYQLSVKGLSQGMYTARVTTTSGVLTQKLLVIK